MTTYFNTFFKTVTLLATFAVISACTGEVSNSEGADLGADTPTLSPNIYEPSTTRPPATNEPSGNVISRTVVTRVSSSYDDVEEGSDGGIYADSSDLEFINDGDDQVVGIRFSVDIPQGAFITDAYIQFTTDEESTNNTTLLITAEKIANAAPFTDTVNNVSSRTTTNASTPWIPDAWTSVGENNTTQRTPSLIAIVQEISNLPDWAPNNHIAFIVTGSGRRTAVSYDGSATQAPTLHVQYSIASGSGPMTPEPVAPAPEPVAPAPEPVAPAPEPVINYTPIAQPDTAIAYTDESITINVLANDTGLSDEPITIDISTPPSNGTAFVDSLNDITYRPTTVSETTTDSFIYRIIDGDGETSTATVSITIECGTTCIPEPSITKTVRLTWSPNVESNIDGYYVYIGTQSGVYEETVWVENTSYDYPADSSPLYFAITAVNTQGVESAYSDEVFVN